MPREHKYYYDLMRIVAIFFVIFNHTGTAGFALHSTLEPGSLSYFLSLMLSVFCTFAVPLFFMISGALVLPRADLPSVYKKRIPKQVGILLLFSALYYFWSGYRFGTPTRFATLNGPVAEAAGLPGGTGLPETLAISAPGLKLFLKVLYSGAWNFSFWFLYAYIAFLISAPLLKTLAEHLSNQQYLYLFGIYLVFKAGVPLVNWTLFRGDYSLNNGLMLTWAVSDIVIYPLAGYYLEHRFSIETLRQKKWLLPLLWGTTLLCLLLAAALTWRKSLLTGSYAEGTTQTFHRIFNLVVAGTVYLSIKVLFAPATGSRTKRETGAGKVGKTLLRSAGACTFGIYLLHVAVLKDELMTNVYEFLTVTHHWPKLCGSFAEVVLTLLICWAVTALWKGVLSLVRRKA